MMNNNINDRSSLNWAIQLDNVQLAQWLVGQGVEVCPPPDHPYFERARTRLIMSSLSSKAAALMVPWLISVIGLEPFKDREIYFMAFQTKQINTIKALLSVVPEFADWKTVAFPRTSPFLIMDFMKALTQSNDWETLEWGLERLGVIRDPSLPNPVPPDYADTYVQLKQEGRLEPKAAGSQEGSEPSIDCESDEDDDDHCCEDDDESDEGIDEVCAADELERINSYAALWTKDQLVQYLNRYSFSPIHFAISTNNINAAKYWRHVVGMDWTNIPVPPRPLKPLLLHDLAQCPKQNQNRVQSQLTTMSDEDTTVDGNDDNEDGYRDKTEGENEDNIGDGDTDDDGDTEDDGDDLEEDGDDLEEDEDDGQYGLYEYEDDGGPYDSYSSIWRPLDYSKCFDSPLHHLPADQTAKEACDWMVSEGFSMMEHLQHPNRDGRTALEQALTEGQGHKTQFILSLYDHLDLTDLPGQIRLALSSEKPARCLKPLLKAYFAQVRSQLAVEVSTSGQVSPLSANADIDAAARAQIFALITKPWDQYASELTAHDYKLYAVSEALVQNPFEPTDPWVLAVSPHIYLQSRYGHTLAYEGSNALWFCAEQGQAKALTALLQYADQPESVLQLTVPHHLIPGPPVDLRDELGEVVERPMSPFIVADSTALWVLSRNPGSEPMRFRPGSLSAGASLLLTARKGNVLQALLDFGVDRIAAKGPR